MRASLGPAVAIPIDESLSQYCQADFCPDWCSLQVARLAAPWTVPAGPEPHAHDAEEYWLLLYGSAQVSVGEHASLVDPNSVVCTPHGVMHQHHTTCPTQVVAAVGQLPEGGRAGHLRPRSVLPSRSKPWIPEVEMSGSPIDDVPDPKASSEALVLDGPDNGVGNWPSTKSALSEFRILHPGTARSINICGPRRTT